MCCQNCDDEDDDDDDDDDDDSFCDIIDQISQTWKPFSVTRERNWNAKVGMQSNDYAMVHGTYHEFLRLYFLKLSS